MTEFVLNGQSFNGRLIGKIKAVECIASISSGMAQLVNARRVRPILRTSHQLSDLHVGENLTLHACILSLLRIPSNREEAQFWLQLSQKTPLALDLPESTIGEYQQRQLAPECQHLGEVILLCCVTDGVAVSVPSDPKWNTDQIPCDVHWMDDKLEVHTVSDRADNIANKHHAAAIKLRWLDVRIENATPIDICTNANCYFDNLIFGTDVESQVANFDPRAFRVILKRLRELNATAVEWRVSGSANAPFLNNVSDESQNVYQNPKLADQRVFKDAHGISQRYMLHAKCTNGTRVHFREHRSLKKFEIGYIGPHLPI